VVLATTKEWVTVLVLAVETVTAAGGDPFGQGLTLSTKAAVTLRSRDLSGKAVYQRIDGH